MVSEASLVAAEMSASEGFQGRGLAQWFSKQDLRPRLELVQTAVEGQLRQLLRLQQAQMVAPPSRHRHSEADDGGSEEGLKDLVHGGVRPQLALH